MMGLYVRETPADGAERSLGRSGQGQKTKTTVPSHL